MRGIFGRNLSFEECRDLLRGMNFRRLAVRLILVLRLNDERIMSNEVDDAQRDASIMMILGIVFDDRTLLSRALNEWRSIKASGQPYRPISSQAVLALIEFGGRYCMRTGGGSVDEGPYCPQLAHVLLSIQAELVSRVGLRQVESGIGINDASEAIHPELVRNRMAHNPEWYTRNAMARIYVLGLVPAIAEGLPAGFTPAGFFKNRLGLEPGQFLMAALLTGLFLGNFNPDAPSIGDIGLVPEGFFARIQPVLRGKVREYIELATQPEDRVGESIVGLDTLADLIYRSTSFYVRPILAFDDFAVCTSEIDLKNKFLVGIVHLAQDLRRTEEGGTLPADFVKEVGGEFGNLFESYIRWLFCAWFGSWPKTRLHFGYRIPPSEGTAQAIRRETLSLFEETRPSYSR